MTTITVLSVTGRTIEAKILRPGDAYGLNDCMKWGHDCGKGICDPIFRKKYQEENGQKLGIEFTDTTNGQRNFTGGRYYLETILKTQGLGLDLNGGEPAWTIPATEMEKVLAFARTF